MQLPNEVDEINEIGVREFLINSPRQHLSTDSGGRMWDGSLSWCE